MKILTEAAMWEAVVNNNPEYDNPDILEELSLKVGVSSFHLQRTYKKHTGKTPKAYLQYVRIKKARALLEENRLSNTEICYMVGFSSLSSFYAAFRAEAGVSPRQYKQNNCEMRGDVHEYYI